MCAQRAVGRDGDVKLVEAGESRSSATLREREAWSVNQFPQIAYHQMRAMLLQLLGIPFARDADHKSEVPSRAGLNSGDGILDDNRSCGSTPSSFAAIKNVSGAGFPASCCAWIMLPSTCTSKKASNLAAFKTVAQF